MILSPAGTTTVRLRDAVTAWASLVAGVTSRRRFVVMLTAHLGLSATSLLLACWLRFDGAVPATVLGQCLASLPWVLVIRGGVFMVCGLYGSLWRYTGIWDLSRIVLAVFTSSALLYLLVFGPTAPAGWPRSILVIDTLLLISLLGGVRLLRRLAQAGVPRPPGRRVLIIGAGDAGEMILREMRRAGGHHPVGFVDDNRTKVGRTIHGVTVLGTRDDLPRIIETTDPQEVLIAIPSGKAAVLRTMVQLLEPFKLPITTLPDIKELVNGTVGVQQIRPLAIEDLLPRSPVALDTVAVRDLINGRRVLVTGAGGSIGAELCRQIAALEPSRLVLFERYENSLFAIANELGEHHPTVPLIPVIGDVTDANRVDDVFALQQPDLVFHAAAHKHVPLMEHNPCEAVKNNIGGTRTVAEAARRHGVERFVLISTDKAANPLSVMGATKRVAEMIVQAVSHGSQTRFVIVRFGNVLGSNGSVIPRMLEQIRAGGPVTVTHPEMRRYFMLIPEAVELVLQAAVLATNRETFVLDMGEQFKVLDIARNLIRLSGFLPEEEIPITFIGLRPGEKLTEELVGRGETLEPCEVSKIFRVRWPEAVIGGPVMHQVEVLVRAAVAGDVEEVMRRLIVTVPTFTRPQKPAARNENATEPGRGRTVRGVPVQPVATVAVASTRTARRA